MSKLVKTICLLCISISIFAGQVRFSHRSESMNLTKSDGMDKIEINNAFVMGKAGDPAIPLHSASLLMPFGEKASSIEIENIEFGETINNVDLSLVKKNVPFSLEDLSDYITKKSDVYSRDQFFPSLDTEPVNGMLAGHNISSFSFPSAVYNPVTKELKQIKNIDFVINTINDSSRDSYNMLSNNEIKVDRIRKIVSNPELLNSYPNKSTADKIDLLLISSNTLLPEFEDYLNFKRNNGFIVETISVEEIEGNYSGSDKQEKIRNCIIDFYQNHELDYVILGGDSAPTNTSNNIIPHRGFYCNPDDASYADSDIPADIYYSNLDGNWNTDNDNKYAEPGEEDFYSEIAIGRICVNTATEIANNVHKLRSYQETPVLSSLENYLMVGELLWEGTWGKQYLTQVSEGSDANGYTTEGFTSNITRHTLYEMDANWSKSQLYGMFNNTGLNMLHHLGHSATTYNMKLDNSDLTTTNFTNDGVTKGYVLGYSQGCYPGAFDNRDTSPGVYVEDCFAEKITNMSTGEAAFIANSRYGWGEPGGTDGPSQYFHRQYADAIFGENITAIGYANSDSKEDNISFVAGNGMIRWCYYQLNLFGDPSLDIYTQVPTDFTCAIPQGIMIGTNSLSLDTEVPFARSSLILNNEIIAAGVADENGVIDYNFVSNVQTAGVLTLTLSGHNKVYKSVEIPVISDQAYVIVEEYTIVDENGNGQADYNETITLDVTFKNIGNQNSSNIDFVITTTNGELIEILDGEQTVNAINSGSSFNSTGAFSFKVSETAPDQTSAKFNVEGIDGENHYLSSFRVTLNAPDVDISHTSSVTSAPSNNENITYTFDFLNNGHFQLENGLAVLSCNNNNITINEPSRPLPLLNAGNNEVLEFAINIGELPTNTIVDFELELSNSVGYLETYNFTQLINNPVFLYEDFASFPPADWTTDAQNWEGASSSNAGGSAPEVQFNWNPSQVGDFSLISKSVDISEFYQVGVVFRHAVNDYSGSGYELKVMYEFDNSGTWSELHTYPPETHSASQDSLFINNGDVAQTLRVKWMFSGDSYQINYWYIDDVEFLKYTLPDATTEILPLTTELLQNYPNPFNPSTAIRFSLPSQQMVSLKIFNSAGQMVEKLVNDNFKAGYHNIMFNAEKYSSGIYYYTLQTSDKLITKKMVLIK